MSQVSVGEALVALRGHLERIQLDLYEYFVTGVVDAPVKWENIILILTHLEIFVSGKN